MLTKLFHPVFTYIYNVIALWKAKHRKRLSEQALARLDDRLLDDIGMRRIEGQIMPIQKAEELRKQLAAKQHNNLVGNKAQKRLFARKRLRHPYLLRRRQE